MNTLQPPQTTAEREIPEQLGSLKHKLSDLDEVAHRLSSLLVPVTSERVKDEAEEPRPIRQCAVGETLQERIDHVISITVHLESVIERLEL